MDDTGDSHYVVGGRAYFEGNIFGFDGPGTMSSFTYKGFFDQAGYEEPKSTIGKLKAGWVWFLVVVGILIIGAVVLTIYCCKKKKDAKSKVE